VVIAWLHWSWLVGIFEIAIAARPLYFVEKVGHCFSMGRPEPAGEHLTGRVHVARPATERTAEAWTPGSERGLELRAEHLPGTTGGTSSLRSGVFEIRRKLQVTGRRSKRYPGRS
jgi:hypothetical protein